MKPKPAKHPPKARPARAVKKKPEGLNLSPQCLEAFKLYKARDPRERSDSEAFLMLLENSQVERLFDATTPQDFFRGTEQQDQITPMSELELVRRGAETLKIPLEQLVRSGAIFLAKREILTRSKHLEGGSQETPRSGIAGSADARMQEAFSFLEQAGKEVTPARLAKLSRTNFNSAQRWLGLNHPHLLLAQPLRPRQARPMRFKPATPPAAAAAEPQENPSPTAPPPSPSPLSRAAEPKKRKAADAVAALPPAQPAITPTPIAFEGLPLTGNDSISLAYGAVNERGSVFFSAEALGDHVRDEALKAHQLDPSGDGHIELIFHQGHHLAPVVWLMLLYPKHKKFFERITSRIQRSVKKQGRRAP
jgi:hypothetical protein